MKDRGYWSSEGMQRCRLFWVVDANVEGLLIFFTSCTLSFFLLLLFAEKHLVHFLSYEKTGCCDALNISYEKKGWCRALCMLLLLRYLCQRQEMSSSLLMWRDR